MVGTRVDPDNNDIVVWKLDELTTPFVNSSTSPSAPTHAVSDLTSKSGNTLLLQQPSPFAASGTNSAVLFAGTDTGSPRNFISGANGFQPQPPITVSAWIYLRTYDNTGFTQHFVNKQTNTGTWSGTSFDSIVIQNERYNSQPQRFDFSLSNNSSNQGGNAVVPVEFAIPLWTWSHIGLTYDGTTVQSFINGNQVGSGVASPGGNIYYGTTPGPWFFGAIPSGSGDPEEGSFSICDVRIANVVRTQSYFQNIYQNAILNAGTQTSVITTYYKMRAFDLYYTTTPLYWTDTTISYANAPTSPSGWGLGPIEIVHTWTTLNT